MVGHTQTPSQTNFVRSWSFDWTPTWGFEPQTSIGQLSASCIASAISSDDENRLCDGEQVRLHAAAGSDRIVLDHAVL